MRKQRNMNCEHNTHGHAHACYQAHVQCQKHAQKKRIKSTPPRLCADKQTHIHTALHFCSNRQQRFRHALPWNRLASTELQRNLKSNIENIKNVPNSTDPAPLCFQFLESHAWVRYTTVWHPSTVWHTGTQYNATTPKCGFTLGAVCVRKRGVPAPL